MKIKHSVCFILKKDFAPVELNILIALNENILEFFSLCKGLMFGVGVPLHNKMKFESLRICCRVETLVSNEFCCDL